MGIVTGMAGGSATGRPLTNNVPGMLWKTFITKDTDPFMTFVTEFIFQSHISTEITYPSLTDASIWSIFL